MREVDHHVSVPQPDFRRKLLAPPRFSEWGYAAFDAMAVDVDCEVRAGDL
jgi:hypothetical protein